MKSRFKAVIFDMDGTLTRPTLNFARMREEIGLQPGDIVRQIESLSPDQQRRAWDIIEEHEERALRDQVLQPGCLELLGRCRDASLAMGLVTRNSLRSAQHFQEQYDVRFDGVISREFPFMKPHPEPVLHLLKNWGIAAADVLMVGDYVHDMDCGRAAGTATCFFHNPASEYYGQQADYSVTSMQELHEVIFGESTAT